MPSDCLRLIPRATALPSTRLRAWADNAPAARNVAADGVGHVYRVICPAGAQNVADNAPGARIVAVNDDARAERGIERRRTHQGTRQDGRHTLPGLASVRRFAKNEACTSTYAM